MMNLFLIQVCKYLLCVFRAWSTWAHNFDCRVCFDENMYQTHLCLCGSCVCFVKDMMTKHPQLFCATATHCNTLQRTVTHCNTLQHTATHCNDDASTTFLKLSSHTTLTVSQYGVATTCRLLKIIGLFCKRAL